MGRTGGHRKRNLKRNTDAFEGRHLDKEQISHIKQYGELHPVDKNETDAKRVKYRKVQDTIEKKHVESSSGSESEGEISAYQQLISTVSTDPLSSSEEDENVDELSFDEDEDSEDEHLDISDAGDEEEDPSTSEDEETSENEENTQTTLDDPEQAGRESKEDETGEDRDDEDGHEATLEDVYNDDEESDVYEEALTFKGLDPFTDHFEKDISEDLMESLSESSGWDREQEKISLLGKATVIWPKKGSRPCTSDNDPNIKKLHVKEQLCKHAEEFNRNQLKVESLKTDCCLTSLQHRLFHIMASYQDLYHTDRNWQNGEEIRLSYCLHALNHILKTRNNVIGHNTKMKQKEANVNDDYRDQGLTRPKVLIVLPFRESAYRVVRILTELLMPKDQCFVMNKKRFYSEYGRTDEEISGNKPDDFQSTFAGNIDDHFRIGIGVAKKTLKLYTEFYSSDIIIASPLGLRTVIGVEGEEQRDYDFLSSIEILIFDQTDIFLMQNWDHIQHLMKHMHLQPREAHGVDFSRIRMWTLSGWSKFYRQTMIFSSVASPEINALFNKCCFNYSGKILIPNPSTTGTICQIITPLPQVFHRVNTSSYASLSDERFEFFIKKILPQHRSATMYRTFIFIPSYFDFVRVRNYFKKEEINFVQISEYSNDKSVDIARGVFCGKKIPFMLLTERSHFYRRLRLRGIRHVIFYELPLYPHFYSEICNTLHNAKKKRDSDNYTCSVIYSKYDAQRLAAIVGTSRAGHMINADKSVHMFVTGDT